MADRFDHACPPGHLDHVAHAQCVAEQDEHAGDDVLHQLLRAEPDREPDHAGAGQERRDVDPELGEDQEQRDQAEEYQHETPGDVEQRAGPTAETRLAVGVPLR